MEPILAGVFLGAAAGAFDYKTSLWIDSRKLHMSGRRAQVFSGSGYALRVLIYVGLVAAVVYMKQIPAFGVGLGLPAAVIFYLSHRNKRKNKRIQESKDPKM